MRKLFFLMLVMTLTGSINVFGAHYYYDNFQVTQHNPAEPSSIVLDLLTLPPEICYYESPGDISKTQFIKHNDFATYNTILTPTGITGGAADILNIISNYSLEYTGTAPGTLILSSFNGSEHLFDPLFSNYLSLVFDVHNFGSNAVNVLPRIGPSGLDYSSSIYNYFDEAFSYVNIITIAAGDTATFIFGLGLDSFIDPSVVWDYANGPHSQFELLFQPSTGTGFEVRVDNIGLVVPEPGACLLFGLGIFIFNALFLKKK